MIDSSRTVVIYPPDIPAVQAAAVSADVAVSRDHWLALAQEQDASVVYFSIYLQDKTHSWNERLVGQILLHDYDRERQA